METIREVGRWRIGDLEQNKFTVVMLWLTLICLGAHGHVPLSAVKHGAQPMGTMSMASWSQPHELGLGSTPVRGKRSR